MIYTEQTKKAMRLCFDAHKDQRDKGGLPYVFHPFHLAEQMQTEETVIAALLHDVVEDTEYTFEDIRAMGFSEDIIRALLLLTHDATVPYLDYVARIKSNPIARAVKIVDLQHNSDLSRLEKPGEKDMLRVQKYQEALKILQNKVSPDNIDLFRQKVGICLQHDILFMDLNIREHLKMFAIFKEVPSDDVEEEVNKSITDFHFEDIQNTIAKNLSAGQRRKLSIAISLIGNSEIIFLDEPSSGIDIFSRRNLWEILKKQSDNKIIILTTHYMEEASALGKRIGIINSGKMKCLGDPLFLTEKFGKYMTITLNKDEEADNEAITSFLSQKVEQIQFENLFEEIVARIPKDNFKKEGSISLQKFFEELDENLEKLKVKSYSVSMPTLEDIFLNIAAEDESIGISQEIREEKKMI